jgi:hypothetical protein
MVRLEVKAVPLAPSKTTASRTKTCGYRRVVAHGKSDAVAGSLLHLLGCRSWSRELGQGLAGCPDDRLRCSSRLLHRSCCCPPGVEEGCRDVGVVAVGDAVLEDEVIAEPSLSAHTTIRS